MRLIGVESIVGGAGATSVTVGYASALNDIGWRTIALDLNDANQLGLHFGMPLTQRDGIGAADVLERGLQQVMYESAEGYPFIPFGYVPPDRARSEGSRLALMLDDLLAPLFAIPERVLVVDIPRNHEGLRDWVYKHADLVLNVVQPEPRAVPALLRYAVHQRGLQQAGGAKSLLLFNAVAPWLELAQDTLELLRAQISGDAQCPVLIHRDMHIPEAFASQTPVRSKAPSCQSADDFEALALWTCSWFGEWSADIAAGGG